MALEFVTATLIATEETRTAKTAVRATRSLSATAARDSSLARNHLRQACGDNPPRESVGDDPDYGKKRPPPGWRPKVHEPAQSARRNVHGCVDHGCYGHVEYTS